MLKSTQYSYQLKFLFLFCLLYIFLFQISCTHEVIDLSLADTICYESQIAPVLQNSCGTTACHDALTAAEDFIASDYESIMELVQPGDPKSSELYTVLIDIWGESFMPPDNPLPIADRNLIQLWILQGASRTSCETDTNGGNPNPDTICFVQDILPVFSSACAIEDCHDAITRQEDYNLSTYSSIMSSEEGIVPGDPENSEIYDAITENDPDDRMPPPPRPALTTEQIAAIREWIQDGALNSNCPETNCDTLSPILFSSQLFPIIQNNCITCHGSPPGNGGILLNSYENVREAAMTQRNGISLIVGAIRNLGGFSDMPPDNPMSECPVRIIELWIEQGMQNN